MENDNDQSAVAYGGKKEIADNKSMPNSKPQSGKMGKMTQTATKSYVQKTIKHHENKMHRHKEHR